VGAAIVGPHHGKGRADYYIRKSGARLLRLHLAVASRTAWGSRTTLNGTVNYSRYGERSITRLPASCRFVNIDPTGVEPFRVEGEAMRPALRTGQNVWVDRLAYQGHPVQRGDVVVFKAVPAGVSNRYFIKRVIGLPGETVAVRHHSVYINGRRLNERYVHYPADYTFPARKMPAGQYFVLGDNRSDSYDSHMFGPIRLHDIIGRAVLPRVTYS
jgi:signal peptidase I